MASAQEARRRRRSPWVAVGAAALAAVGAASARRRRRWPRSGPATPRAASAFSMPAAAPPAMRGPEPKGDAQLELAGGLELKTPFGTFVPPEHLAPIPRTASALVGRAISPTPCCAAFRLAAGISIRPFPSLLCAHEAGRRRRPLRLPEDAAGGRRARRRATSSASRSTSAAASACGSCFISAISR